MLVLMQADREREEGGVQERWKKGELSPFWKTLQNRIRHSSKTYPKNRTTRRKKLQKAKKDGPKKRQQIQQQENK